MRASNRAPRNGFIYLNPYASSAIKCLGKQLLTELLDVLADTCASAVIFCPGIPGGIADAEKAFYEALNDCVTKAAIRRRVHRLPAMDKTQFLQTVRNASLVVGSDTSTQHVASMFGVASVACYPPGAGYRFYFWSSPGTTNLCVSAPDESDRAAVRSLAEFVGSLGPPLADGSTGAEQRASVVTDRSISHRVRSHRHEGHRPGASGTVRFGGFDQTAAAAVGLVGTPRA